MNISIFNKRIQCLLIICLSVSFAFGQNNKPPLDTAAFFHWPNISDIGISNNGKYVYYNTTTTFGIKQTTTVQSLAIEWKKKLGNVSAVQFTSDNRYVIWKTVGDSIAIMKLDDTIIQHIPSVVSLRLIETKEGDILLYTKKTGNELVLRYLKNNTEKKYDNVAEYLVNESNSALVVTKANPEQSNETIIYWIDLVSGNIETIWSGPKASNLLLDHTSSQLAFLTKSNPSQTGSSLWVYDIENKKMQTALDAGSLPTSFDIVGISNFSKDNKRLFLYIGKQNSLSPSSSNVKVDVWSYTDTLLQSTQLLDLRNANRYLAFLDLSLSTTKVVQLQTENELVMTPFATYDDWILTSNSNSKYYSESYWSKVISKTRAFSAKSGTSSIFDSLSNVVVSPDSKFFIGEKFENGQLESYVFEIGTNRHLKISNLIDVPATVDQPRLNRSKHLSFATWLPESSYALFYDSYDIWKVDLTRKTPPVCITNHYGRTHHLIFRVPARTAISNAQSFIVEAFNDITKEAGFFMIDPMQGKNPSPLFMGPYNFDCTVFEFGAPKIIKARDANVFVVRRSSATESPNYYMTTDFKQFIPISDIHPEKQYNWLTSELIEFKQSDGKLNHAIVYKPENFNPAIRYPVIIHYYESKTDGLYQFPLIQGNDNMDFSISWFVSHGYVVVTPDILYEFNRNAQCALESVTSVAKYLRMKSWVDGSHIGLQGESFGGYETNYIISQTNQFSAAVSSSGMCDLIALYGGTWGGGAPLDGYFRMPGDQGRMTGTIWERPQDYLTGSPVLYAHHVSTPILTIANKLDGNVPVAQGVEWFTALRRLGKRAWMLQYDEGRHGLLNKPYSLLDFFIRSTQFFDHYLKDSAAPRWMLYGIPAKMKGIDDGLELVREKDKNGKWLTPKKGGLLIEEEKKKVEALKKRKPITMILE